MTAASVDIAETIKDLINTAAEASEFDFLFTAVRAYVPPFVLEDAIPQGLQVFVSPTTHGLGTLTRVTPFHQVGAAVSVIHKPDDRSNESLDPLVNLVEQIKLLLWPRIVVDGQSALVTINEEPLYRPQQPIESAGLFWGAFTAIVNLPRTP